MKKCKLIVSVMGFTMALALSAQSAVLASWDMDGIGAVDSDASDSGAVASTLSKFASSTHAADGYGDSIGLRILNQATSDTLAEAIANDDYVTFTIDGSGFGDLDYTQIRYRTSDNNGLAVSLMSSATGFTDGDEIDTFTAAAAGNPEYRLNTINLTGVGALQNNISSVEFRLYLYDGDRVSIGTAFAATADFDLEISGDFTAAAAAVPEPATASLILVGVAGLALNRRRLIRT